MQSKIEDGDGSLYQQLLKPKPFRYPVLTSDGHNYESCLILKWLMENNHISPKTGESIYWVTYNLPLKNEIDEVNPEDRYPEYNKEIVFKQLKSQLNASMEPWEQAIYKTSLTIALVICLLAIVDWMVQGNSFQPSSLACLIFSTAALDYFIRINTDYQKGFVDFLGKGTKTVVKSGEICLQALLSVDPELDEAILRI